jgi:hypothetical protein
MVGKTSLAVAAASDAIAGWTRQAEAKPTLFYDRDTASEIWSRASSGGGFSEVTRLFRWYATYGSRTCGIKRYRSAWLDGCMFGIDEVWMQFETYRPEAYSMYVGGHKAKRAPQIAILSMRPAGTSRGPFLYATSHA